ncbi:MAG: pilus assembly protein [Quinella sp. 2Q5]|nr:pilus assembly protein [Quinella sp. 2Q5]
MRIRFRRRGQVLVLYALLIPLLIMCLGVGLDLGWYYLKVSRLQNAADAAALAGARALAKKKRGHSR